MIFNFVETSVKVALVLNFVQSCVWERQWRTNRTDWLGYHMTKYNVCVCFVVGDQTLNLSNGRLMDLLCFMQNACQHNITGSTHSWKFNPKQIFNVNFLRHRCYLRIATLTVFLSCLKHCIFLNFLSIICTTAKISHGVDLPY